MTTPRPLSESELHGYADRRLAPDHAAEVEALLARDPEAAARVNAIRAQNAQLAQALDPWLAEPIPAFLLTSGNATRIPLAFEMVASGECDRRDARRRDSARLVRPRGVAREPGHADDVRARGGVLACDLCPRPGTSGRGFGAGRGSPRPLAHAPARRAKSPRPTSRDMDSRSSAAGSSRATRSPWRYSCTRARTSSG